MTRERSENETLAWSLSIYPRLARTDAEVEVGLKHATQAVRIAEDIGNPAMRVTGLTAMGIAEADLGRFEQAIATLETALSEARERQIALFEEAPILIHLSRAHLRTGDGAAARAVADEAVAVAHRQGASVHETLALLTRARVRRATGSPRDEVDADLVAALALARETGATAYERAIEAENNSCISSRLASVRPFGGV